jgi:O-antigen/teichoic acid export membrane protein
MSRTIALRHTLTLAGSTFLVTAAGAAFALLAQICVARWIGASEYGHYAYVMSWVVTLAVVAKCGWDTAALRVMPANAAIGNWSGYRGFARYSARWVLLAGGAIALVMLVVAGLWRTLDPALRAALLWAVLLLPVLALAELLVAWLQSQKRNVTAQLSYGVFRPVALVAMVGLAALSGIAVDAARVVFANIVIMLMVMALLALALHRSWPAAARGLPAAAEPRQWWLIAAPLFAIAISQLVLSRADVLVAGMYLDSSAVGVYAAANQLAMLVTFGIATTNSVTAPMISEHYSKGDRAGLRASVRLTSRMALAFTIPACLLLGIFGRDILNLFGAGFSGAFGALLLLAVGQLVIAVCGPVGFLLTMTTHQNSAFYVICLAACLHLGLVLLLTPKFGILGAAAGSALGNASRSLILTWVVRRKLGLNATAF